MDFCSTLGKSVSATSNLVSAEFRMDYLNFVIGGRKNLTDKSFINGSYFVSI